MGEAVGNFRTVMFACARNAGLSQMAAAFFNDLANPAQAKAVAAGFRLSSEVRPEVVRAMRETGLDLSLTRPQLFTAELAMLADRFVILGSLANSESLPTRPHDEWPVEDAETLTSERAREIRDEIRSRVWKLLAEEGWFAKATADFGQARAERARRSKAPSSTPDLASNTVAGDAEPPVQLAPEVGTPSPTEAPQVVAEAPATVTAAPQSDTIPVVQGDAAGDTPTKL